MIIIKIKGYEKRFQKTLKEGMKHIKIIKSYLLILPVWIFVLLLTILGIFCLTLELGIIISGMIVALIYLLQKHGYFISLELFYLKFISFFFNDLYNKTVNDLNKQLKNKNDDELKLLIKNYSFIIPNDYDLGFNVYQGNNLNYSEFKYLRKEWDGHLKMYYPSEHYILTRALSDSENKLIHRLEDVKKRLI